MLCYTISVAAYPHPFPAVAPSRFPPPVQVPEFKPKWLTEGGNAPAPAGPGGSPSPSGGGSANGNGNSGPKGHYNPGANEFVPGGNGAFVPPSAMQTGPMGPTAIGYSPNGTPIQLFWNPAIQQYIPMNTQVPPNRYGGPGGGGGGYGGGNNPQGGGGGGQYPPGQGPHGAGGSYGGSSNNYNNQNNNNRDRHGPGQGQGGENSAHGADKGRRNLDQRNQQHGNGNNQGGGPHVGPPGKGSSESTSAAAAAAAAAAGGPAAGGGGGEHGPKATLPEGNAIRFGSMPPARVEEGKPDSPIPSPGNSSANLSVSAAAAAAAAAATAAPAAATAAAAKPAVATTAAAALAAGAPSSGTGTVQWGKGPVSALHKDDTNTPLQRGLSVPASGAGNRNNKDGNTAGGNKGGDGNGTPTGDGPVGWKRGESMPLSSLTAPGQNTDGHVRYDKSALLALFCKGKNQIPAEIKALYGSALPTTERLPLTTKVNSAMFGGGHGNNGGGGNNSGGQGRQGGNNGKRGKHAGETEVHPDEASIFDFSKKVDTFAYVKDRLADDKDPDVICAKANLLLNKLSVTKFEKLSDDFMKVGMDSPELMKKGVEMIVLKAQMEEHFCFMYADLCRKMTDMWVSQDQMNEEAEAAASGGAESNSSPLSEAGTPLGMSREASSTNIAGSSKEESSPLGKRFRACLLTRCQDEFSVDRTEALTMIRENEELNAEDKEEKEILLKKRYTGHMRFIGELYIKDLVSGNIMHRCIADLLTATEEEQLVCLCKLLVTIGFKLETYDRRKGADNFNSYFQTISEIATTHTNSRMRFMLRDLMDQRDSGWVVRREEEKAMDISDLRNGPAKGNKQGSPRNDGNSHTPAPDEWTTVATSKKGGGPSGSSGKGGSSSARGFGGSGDVRASGSGSAKASPTHGSGNAFSALQVSSRNTSGAPASPAGKGGSSWSKSPSSKESLAGKSSGRTFGSSDNDGASSNPARYNNSAANGNNGTADSSPRGDDDEDDEEGEGGGGTAAVKQNVPGADGSVAADVRLKVRSAVSEYYMNSDEAEALMSMRDIIHPNAMGSVLGNPKGCFDLVFEKHPGNGKPLVALLEYLYTSKFITQETILSATNMFLDNFDETVIDTPKASEYGSQILAGLVHAGV